MLSSDLGPGAIVPGPHGLTGSHADMLSATQRRKSKRTKKCEHAAGTKFQLLKSLSFFISRFTKNGKFCYRKTLKTISVANKSRADFGTKKSGFREEDGLPLPLISGRGNLLPPKSHFYKMGGVMYIYV